MSLYHRIVVRKAVRLSLAALLAATAYFSFSSASRANPGDLYVTDLATGSVIVYAPDGTSSVFATGLTSPQGIVFDQGKNLYVADAGDGTNGAGAIYMYNIDTMTRTLVRDNLNNPRGLALDGSDLLVSDAGLDRVIRVPIGAGHTPSVFQIVDNPYGLASHAFGQAGFNRFIANGESVLKVDATGSTTDIFPGGNSQGVAVTTVQLSGEDAEVVFVTTSDGTVNRIVNGTPDGSPLTSGLVNPVGMDFRPARFNGDTQGVGDLYVADPDGSQIVNVKLSSSPVVFATGGKPNFMVFEINSPAVTPTPTPTPTATPTPVPIGKALNISTRVDVETGDNVAIGGFIVSGGTTSKMVAIRAIGPSLSGLGVSNALTDPILELHEPDGTVITNDNWKDNSDVDQGVIVAKGLNMLGSSVISNKESIIIATLPPQGAAAGSGLYTAIVRGVGDVTGVGLVEIYDLDDPTADAELANISTRGIVGTADDVLIGGVIVGPDGGLDTSVVVRALGPSLGDSTPPVEDALADPFVELHNGDGDVITTNDNWQDNDDAQMIQNMGLAPSDPAEGAIFANLLPGQYTAIVMGVNATVGVALVEIYHVATPGQ